MAIASEINVPVKVQVHVSGPTQAGAINAALILCPRSCHKNHIARCPVCTHLEEALREVR